MPARKTKHVQSAPRPPLARKMRGTGAAKPAMPPRHLAPEAMPPIAQTGRPQAVAPWPLIDRYPIVQGSRLTVEYVSAVFRLATTGYRQQYVDLLGELLEQDPHLFSVLSKRILSTANARLEITAADVPEDGPDFDLAKETAEMVRAEIARIPDLSRAFAELLWGLYYGVATAEIFWSRDSDGWHIDRLEFVHTRRLSYPDSQSWDLCIWDQGQVLGWQSPWGEAPTNSATFGTRIADWPGKFITFRPQLRGEYPTRDGLGRQTAVWSIFKRIGARNAVAYLERFSKPFMDVAYTTTDGSEQDGPHRQASEEDQALARRIVDTIGPGGASGVSHPDSITVEPKTFEGASSGGTKLTYTEWIGVCNGEHSKAVLGSTLGTEVGHGGGNRALGEVMERSELDIEQYDAGRLGEAVKRDLVTWLVRLNKPEALHLVPDASIHVGKDPDPKAVLENADKMTKMGGRVDLDKLADQTGLTLIPNEPGADGKTRPRGSFTSDVVDPTLVEPDLLSPEAKQEKLDDKAHDQQVEIEKAKAPKVAPGVPGAAPPAGKAPSAKKPRTKMTADELAADQAIEASHRVLLSDATFHMVGRGRAKAVYEQLLDDYPASALGWILSAQWRGPVEVPLAHIDFSERRRWTASKEQASDPASIEAYVQRIRGGKRKPAVMVVRPSNPLHAIVDGHHRTLAQESMGWPVLAYVADVQVDDGPWASLHNMQKSGSSKGSYSTEPASYLAPDEIDQHA